MVITIILCKRPCNTSLGVDFSFATSTTRLLFVVVDSCMIVELGGGSITLHPLCFFVWIIFIGGGGIIYHGGFIVGCFVGCVIDVGCRHRVKQSKDNRVLQ